MRHLRTAQQVVDALGGYEGVCALCETNLKAVWHWVGGVGMFPASEMDRMQRALKRRRCTAPAWLWNQRGAERAA
jgi:predicted small integral membrane protein